MVKQVSNVEVDKSKPLISIRQLNKSYALGDNSIHVLKDIDLDIYAGEFISIMGPSGSGKSTLINILGFLDNKFEGTYHLNDQPIENRTDQQVSKLRNEMVGFIFQNFNLVEGMKVKENVQLPLLYGGYTANKTSQKVNTALEKVGLAEKVNNHIHELSGGQRQRVAIARALINDPLFIIADEPTGALDSKTATRVMDILAKLHAEDSVTVVMVTHNPDLQQYATRHLKIVDGVLSESDAKDAAQLTRYFNQSYEEEDENESN